MPEAPPRPPRLELGIRRWRRHGEMGAGLLQLGLQEADAAAQIHDGSVPIVEHRQQLEAVGILSRLLRLAAQGWHDPQQTA